MPVTAYRHIETNSKGVACIDGTRTKVRDIAMDHIAYGWNAEQIHRQHPHLSLAQIHSALAYYYDHKAQVDKEIEDGHREVEQLRREFAESPAAAKLRAAKAARQHRQ